jgi:hypothetical protein
MIDRGWRWIWQPDLGEGAELFAFRTVPGGCEARGDVVATVDGASLNARYTVEADAEWRTRRVLVELNDGARIEIQSDGAGHWRRADGAPLPELDGCIDPDISMTPFTNTLPIRRLGLGVGDAAEIGVAYILVPDLTLRAAPQRYTRLGERLWRFESLDADFAADIAVDEHGFVVDYPGLFCRG